MGIGLLYFSDEVKEQVIDYTYCNRTSGSDTDWQNVDDTCINVIRRNSSEECICRIEFNLDNDFKVNFIGFTLVSYS